MAPLVAPTTLPKHERRLVNREPPKRDHEAVLLAVCIAPPRLTLEVRGHMIAITVGFVVEVFAAQGGGVSSAL